MSLLPLLFAFVLLISGVVLLFVSERQRRTIGLPSGQVIYADVGSWRPNERPIRSTRYGLAGKPDYLVDTVNGIVPVEVKSTILNQPEPYPSHKLQLAAYCLLVEDTTGTRPPFGIIRYANTTVRLPFDDNLRTALLDALTQMRRDRQSSEVRRSHADVNRCRRCGYNHACGSQMLAPS